MKSSDFKKRPEQFPKEFLLNIAIYCCVNGLGLHVINFDATQFVVDVGGDDETEKKPAFLYHLGDRTEL